MLQNISLKPYNTFGIEATAERFIAVNNLPQLRSVLRTEQPALVLGGGSNMLLTQNVKGLVIKNEFEGIEIIEETNDFAIVKFGAGENWHQAVLWAIENGLGGIENLSLIPGTIGAAPIQNIGAYGVELQHVFVELQAVYLKSGRLKTFQKKDCKFGYRDSVFKRRLKGKCFIISVTLKLSKKHQINLNYGAIKTTLEEASIITPTIKNVSDAVIKIRSSKLPDPAELGNSGSFFKNPEISEQQFQQLLPTFPEMVHYRLSPTKVKIPAGWLIEQCGWKGKRVGNTGAHAKQSLVLVNYGNANGQEVKELAFKIQDSVKQKFGILLSPEVNII